MPATQAQRPGAVNRRQGWERSPLGYPTSDVTRLAGGGSFAHFANGSVYWSSATGARVLLTPIRDRWGLTGWEGGSLGYPVADQVPTPAGRGQGAHGQIEVRQPLCGHPKICKHCLIQARR